MIDVRGGKMTYGQRIELGSILANDKLSDVDRYVATMRCLYPWWKKSFATKWVAHYQEVVNGVEFWAKQERDKLSYTPTAEELAAGVNDLGRKLGPMMTVMAMAEKFSKDPDEVLGWEYGKVFGLLYADLESYKYQKRYHKVMEARERAKRLSKR